MLRAFLEEYVVASEGPGALDDPEVRWLRGFYEGDAIPLLPLERYEEVPDPDPPRARSAPT